MSGAKTRSVSLWLTLGGALALLGCFWLAAYALVSTRQGGDWAAYVAHGVAAVVVGISVCGAAPHRPVLEAALAGLLGIGLMAVLFIAAPEPNFSWLAARAGHPLLMASAIALGTAAGAAASAGLVRKRLPPGFFSLSRASVLILAAIGGLLTAAHIAFGFFGVRL